MPQRIQRQRTKGWRKPDGAVYVGRGSKWGNPWGVVSSSVVGPEWFDHKALAMSAVTRTTPLEECVVFSSHSSATDAAAHAAGLFRTYCTVMSRDCKWEYAGWLALLRGKDLMCWCPLDQPCHADVLLDLANR